MPASIRAGTPTRPDLTLCLNRLILRHFQPEAATCVDAARQVSHNCGPKLSRREVGDLSVTGLAGPVWSQNVRFEWLHRDSPGRLCQV